MFRPPVTHYVIRLARHAGLVAAFVVAAVAGAVSGVLFAYAGDLPRISALDDWTPNTITRVHAVNGDVIGEFATERRLVVGFDDISPHLRQAIVSAEDKDFDRHFGVSISRIAITAVQDIIKRRAAGGSTITQQLAKNLFLTPEKTIERKVKEALLAIQIEKRFTKREVLTFYCNQIYLGHGTYGVEAASRLYFDKRARDLSLDEAALLAGIVQLPERQSPFIDLRWATRRRNYVLQRMAEDGYLSPADAEAARARPIVVRGGPSRDESIAPYFVEEVRKHLERTYGARRLYESGLTVYTSLDPALQRVANRALADGLRRIDKRHAGYRGPVRNLLADGASLDAFAPPRWKHPIEVGDVVPAVVVAVEGGRRPGSSPPATGLPAAGNATRDLPPGAARLRVGPLTAELGRPGFAWTRKRAASDLLKPGDLVDVRILKLDATRSTAEVGLEQEPGVDGAVLAIDNRSGRVVAMVGGYSYGRSQWNRAVQADRQMGSVFKPFVYAAAIDRGFTPSSVLLDAPVSFPAGPGLPPYAPLNYDRTFEGAITVRRALEQSRNVPTVRVMEQLGPAQVIAYARRLGLSGQMEPYLATALGASSASLLEVVAAYAAFPNQGVLMRPYSVLSVRDREGNLLEENRPEPHDAIRADTAFVLTHLLQGVVQRGTASAAASLAWPLGGKTGTTNDYTDAWFVGFDPDLTVGVWVGHNDRTPLGHSETGAQAALPIWIEVMQAWIASRHALDDPPRFVPPGNVVFVPVDRTTGHPAPADGPDTIVEAFIAGTEPRSAAGPARR